MIVIPVPLEGDSPCHQLDNLLSERTWLTRPGPAFVMVADLATVPSAGNLPADGEFRVGAEPHGAWLTTYHRVFPRVETDNTPARTLPDPRPRRHAEDGVLQSGPGARYVCNHGYPCVQGLGSFAKRAGRR
jgi:hypothetical protein